MSAEPPFKLSLFCINLFVPPEIPAASCDSPLIPATSVGTFSLRLVSPALNAAVLSFNSFNSDVKFAEDVSSSETESLILLRSLIRLSTPSCKSLNLVTKSVCCEVAAALLFSIDCNFEASLANAVLVLSFEAVLVVAPTSLSFASKAATCSSVNPFEL